MIAVLSFILMMVVISLMSYAWDKIRKDPMGVVLFVVLFVWALIYLALIAGGIWVEVWAIPHRSWVISVLVGIVLLCLFGVGIRQLSGIRSIDKPVPCPQCKRTETLDLGWRPETNEYFSFCKVCGWYGNFWKRPHR